MTANPDPLATESDRRTETTPPGSRMEAAIARGFFIQTVVIVAAIIAAAGVIAAAIAAA